MSCDDAVPAVQVRPGHVCVAAKVEDFQYAADLYSVLTEESGGQLTKMTRKESKMVSFIVQLDQTDFTVVDLQKVSGQSNSVINKMLLGYQSKGNIYSGLLEKGPVISYCDLTQISGDEVKKTSRRSRGRINGTYMHIGSGSGLVRSGLKKRIRLIKNERVSGSERNLRKYIRGPESSRKYLSKWLFRNW